VGVLSLMSQYDLVRENQQRELEELVTRTKLAKEQLKYGYIRETRFRYRIIKWEGCGYIGNDKIPTHKFSYLTGSLPFDEMNEAYIKLLRDKIKEWELPKYVER
jgi:hypothetical protein